jgi:hypothetical protein
MGWVQACCSSVPMIVVLSCSLYAHSIGLGAQTSSAATLKAPGFHILSIFIPKKLSSAAMDIDYGHPSMQERIVQLCDEAKQSGVGIVGGSIHANLVVKLSDKAVVKFGLGVTRAEAKLRPKVRICQF